MLFLRMWRAARFDGALYNELRHDPVAPAQAVAVVALTILATVIGAFLATIVNGGSVVGHVLGALVYFMPGRWLLPAASLFLLGGLARASNPQRGSSRDLLLVMGFSASPAIFLLLLSFPSPVGIVIGYFAMLWVIGAMIVGAKAALDITWARAAMFVLPGVVLGFLLLRG